MTRAAGPPLSPAALGRATLARQHLLARTDLGVPALLEHLIGLQAQAPWAPYAGLWTRLAGFAHADLADRLVDRTAARIVVMRGTIHLLTADDALALPVLLEPLLADAVRVNATYRRALEGVDLAAVAAAARELLEEHPLAPAELGARLAAGWPGTDGAALAQAARALLPLVQVPPRAVWGRTGPAVWTTTRAWLQREPPDLAAPGAREEALDALVLRYLAAYGPASVADAQRWSGLTRLAPALERLRPRLVTFRSEPGPGARSGRELFDLPDAPRPDPGTPAPVRFLPEFDGLTVAHADRTRLVSEPDRRRLWRANGAVPGTLLVGGVVAGAWTTRRAGRDATLVVEPFATLARADRAAVEAEGAALVEFMADTAQTRRVEVLPADG
ncbi:winged helix DNA-binding domain-containing protein [Pengzhenrongella sicca]|uniref:AlkZ family DNA glycosylase n=1 Tax=Pengzhenrongella sicca TaxID=2819238 RepID=A0A8A4ZIC8_9MICO|nr:winged helix DNA-binding domain-containing protein [Pengzhenrongella sicca]QTE30277.1 AlkZ family DNA glycosylase [Pengzhenrongella sicca]